MTSAFDVGPAAILDEFLIQISWLGPPQTRHLVVDNYLLSTTKCYRQLIVSAASISHIGVSVFAV